MSGKHTPTSLRKDAEWMKERADELEGLIAADKYLRNERCPKAQPAFGLMTFGGTPTNMEPCDKTLRIVRDWFHNNWGTHKKDLLSYIAERRAEIER